MVITFSKQYLNLWKQYFTAVLQSTSKSPSAICHHRISYLAFPIFAVFSLSNMRGDWIMGCVNIFNSPTALYGLRHHAYNLVQISPKHWNLDTKSFPFVCLSFIFSSLFTTKPPMVRFTFSMIIVFFQSYCTGNQYSWNQQYTGTWIPRNNRHKG